MSLVSENGGGFDRVELKQFNLKNAWLAGRFQVKEWREEALFSLIVFKENLFFFILLAEVFMGCH